jgi:F-type H+-transporting ATPase subunit delta
MRINKQAKREASQLFRFCCVNGLLDENRVRQVVYRVAAAGYRESPAILAHFLRLVRLDRAQRTARIESATPLPADLRAAAEASLKRQYGPGLITKFGERPSLIGGMRIQVGSDVFDGSVLSKLAALQRRF